jgi:hypothetical protein
VIANRCAALPNDLGEYDLITERGDLDDSRAEAGIADKAGPDAPAMIAADLCGVPMIIPSARHYGWVL